MINKKKIDIEIIFVISMLLMQYSFGFLSIGKIIIYITSILFFLKNKTIYINKSLAILTLFLVFFSITKILFLESISISYLNSIVEKIIIFFSISVFSSFINNEKLEKRINILGWLISGAVLYQSFQIHYLNKLVTMIKLIPFWTPSKFFNYSNRPAGFFSEPAAFVLMVIPFLFVLIKQNKKIRAFIVTLCIFLSTSTTGLVLSFIVWGGSILKKITLKKIIFNLMILLLLLFFLTRFSIFKDTISKLLNTKLNHNFRLSNGYYIIKNLSIENKILGIPYENIGSFLLSEKNTFMQINTSVNYFAYVNTISEVIINYGVIVSVLYLRVFYTLYKSISKENLPYLLTMFIGIFGQSLFFNSFFLIQFILIISLDLNKNRNNSKFYFKIRRKR